MSYSAVIRGIEEVIHDIHITGVEFTPIKDVPNVNSTSSLTFESGDIKRGRTIKTCVMYVDIRDSIKLNQEAQVVTLGKIYTAFTKAVLLAARHDGGCVRNIIGDRVMIIFPEEDCFQHAVHCAFLVNKVAKLIDKEFPSVKFQCGIGIDYGVMNVLKVGIDIRNDEKQEYKNLVWVGYPANYASRLTDVANKDVEEKYRVEGVTFFGKTYDYSKDNLLKSLCVRSGALYPNIYHSVSSIEPIKHHFPTILVSESVYKGYEKNPGDDSITKGLWHKQDYSIRDIKFLVYGSDAYWSE